MAVIPPLTSYVNLGPLPTPISFPASCTNTLYDMRHTYLGLNQFQPTAGCALKDCCPSSKFYTEAWAWYTSYFSPAVCPHDYTSCPGPISPIVLSTLPGETVSFCCPSGKLCLRPYREAMLSPLGYGCPMLSPFYGACGSGFPETETKTLLVLDDISHQSAFSTRLYYSTSSGFQHWVVAYPIQVRRGGSPSPSPSITVPLTSAASESTTSPSTSTPASSISSVSSGVSAGAVVGIALGAVFATAFVGLAIYWWSRKRQANPPPQLELPVDDQTEKQMHRSAAMPYAGLPQFPQELVSTFPGGSLVQVCWLTSDRTALKFNAPSGTLCYKLFPKSFPERIRLN